MHRIFTAVLGLILTGLAPIASASAQPLVSGTWVDQYGDRPGVILLDVRSADTFRAGHVEGSVNAPYPGGWRKLDPRNGTPLPSPIEFERLMGMLGIGRTHHVVIVADTMRPGEAAVAAEVYFTMRYYGHRAVSIVDGGVRGIVASGVALSQGDSPKRGDVARYKANPNKRIAAGFDRVFTALGNSQLIDARSTAKYLGLRSVNYVARAGSIPGSTNLPFNWLIDRNGRFLDKQSIAALLVTVGIDPDEPVLTFGNTSREGALLWFVAHELAGYRKTRLYVGALAEWAAKDFAPMIRRIDLTKKSVQVPAVGRLSNLIVRGVPKG